MNWKTILEDNLAACIKITNAYIFWPSNPTLGIYYIDSYICLQVKWSMYRMFTAVLLVVAKAWKQPMQVKVAQSCLTLCDPIDCSPPRSSFHGISQARILEWVSISYSRESSRPRDWTWVSCIAGRFFTIWDTREALKQPIMSLNRNVCVYSHNGILGICFKKDANILSLLIQKFSKRYFLINKSREQDGRTSDSPTCIPHQGDTTEIQRNTRDYYKQYIPINWISSRKGKQS